MLCSNILQNIILLHFVLFNLDIEMLDDVAYTLLSAMYDIFRVLWALCLVVEWIIV